MSKKVLIVDDEEILAGNFQTYLETLGCNVQTAASGNLALQLLLSFKPDLLLLDYRLPDMTGFDVFDAMCTLHSCEVVMMTAHPSVEVCNSASERHIGVILNKPFPLQELGRVVMQGAPQVITGPEPRYREGAQIERRQGGEVVFPLKLYDGAWVLADRRRVFPHAEPPLKQIDKCK